MLAPSGDFVSTFLPVGVTGGNGETAASAAGAVQLLSGSPPRGAAFIRYEGLPDTVVAGDFVEFNVVMANVGSVGWWAENGYKIATVPPVAEAWSSSLGDSGPPLALAPTQVGCPPAASADAFHLSDTASFDLYFQRWRPAAPTAICLQMRRDDDQWFGATTPNHSVTVVGAVDLVSIGGNSLQEHPIGLFDLVQVKLNAPAPREIDIQIVGPVPGRSIDPSAPVQPTLRQVSAGQLTSAAFRIFPNGLVNPLGTWTVALLTGIYTPARPPAISVDSRYWQIITFTVAGLLLF